MSRILKNKKKLLLCVIAIISVGILFTAFWYVSILVCCAMCLLLVNRRLRRFNSKAMNVLHKRTKIIKIDTLVIGDTCTDDILKQYNNGNTLYIQSPNRSLVASYLIFMHIESLLEQNGKLIIINDSKVNQKYISNFDIPFLNLITRKELGLEKRAKKAEYPLFTSPITSIKIFFNCKKKNYKPALCPKKEFADFCNERGWEFLFLSK